MAATLLPSTEGMSRWDTIGPKVQGKLHVYLAVTLDGEEVEYPFEGLVSIVGMEGPEGKVARFGKSDGVLHGFRIPDLAYEDDVGRLSKGVLQGVEKRVRVEAHLPLRHHALLVRMDKLDGVLDGDDVALLMCVPVIDHGGEARRFSTARSPDHENQAPLRHDDLFESLRKAHFVDRLYLYLDLPEHEAYMAPLEEDVHPEAAEFVIVEGKIHLVLFAEEHSLLLVHDGLSDGLGVGPRQRLLPIGLDHALDAEHRGYPFGEVDIGSVCLHHVLEQALKKGDHLSPSISWAGRRQLLPG